MWALEPRKRVLSEPDHLELDHAQCLTAKESSGRPHLTKTYRPMPLSLRTTNSSLTDNTQLLENNATETPIITFFIPTSRQLFRGLRLGPCLLDLSTHCGSAFRPPPWQAQPGFARGASPRPPAPSVSPVQRPCPARPMLPGVRGRVALPPGGPPGPRASQPH